MEVDSCSTTNSPDETVLDSEGDLHLSIGPEKHRVIVCSKALRRASAVWRTMLFGNFIEAAKPLRPQDAWVVSLPEDEAEPLTIALAMAHGRFSLVPAEMSASRLYRLLVVTDKYDMTDMTRPWARQWLEAAERKQQQLQQQQVETKPVLAWIAWELGDEEAFSRAVDALVVTCHLDADGQLVSEKGTLLSEAEFDPLRPTNIQDHIASVRLETLSAMLRPLAKLYRDLKKGKSNCCEACAMTNLGSLVISASRCGLDPIPLMGSEYSGSVRQLEAQFARLQVMSPHMGPKVVDVMAAMRAVVAMAVDNRTRGVPEFYVRRMAKQREKIGLEHGSKADGA